MSSNDEGPPIIIILALLPIVLGVAYVATPYVIAATVVVFGSFIGWDLYKKSPRKRERDARIRTLELYEEVKRLYEPPEVTWNLPPEFLPVAQVLLREEIGPSTVPPPPAICHSIEGARYRDTLAKMGAVSDQHVKHCIKTIENALTLFYPKLPHETRVPLRYLINAHKAVLHVILPFYESEHFRELRKILDRNLDEADGVFPHEYKKDDVIEVYLKGTPLLQLFDILVPFGIPEELRMEHMHVVAGSGWGKSQLIQHMVLRDLPKVAAGDASIVVIDSQRDMIDRIAHLDIIPRDRLIYINAEDVEHPVALNLFDVKLDRLKQYSPREREQIINGIIEMLEYVLSTLSADMTQKQQLLVRMLIRLMVHVPDATIFTLADALKPNGYDRFRKYIAELDPVTQEFFHTEFNDPKQYGETKRQIQRRLWGIIQNNTFAQMFQSPRNKVDLFDALNRGSVVLVNTSKDVLKGDACSVLGKFIIALVAQAGQERAVLPHGNRLPTYLYVDEASDYFSQTIDTILTQLRKYNIGGIFLHQYLGQLDTRLQQSMFANTSIRFAGGVSANDAMVLAKQLRTTPEFILEQPKGTFAVYLRNVTRTAVPLSIPLFEMEKAPRMSDAEYEELIKQNRELHSKRSESEPEAVSGDGPPGPESTETRNQESSDKNDRFPMGFDTRRNKDDRDNPEIEPI